MSRIVLAICLTGAIVATSEMYPIHLTVPGKSQLSYVEGNAHDGNWFPVEGVQAERDW